MTEKKKEYNIAMTEEMDTNLTQFLLGDPENEEMCFAAWYPCSGHNRFTALLHTTIVPNEGEVEKHGNAAANPAYLDRVKEFARENHAGVAIIHSHPFGRGWQGLSYDDRHTELDILSREIYGVTRLPLVGLTLSGDRTWSARIYTKRPEKKPDLEWCHAVRIVGKKLRMVFNPVLKKPPVSNERQVRTTSIWGEDKQSQITRLRVGIIGVGSVGTVVAEILARMGVGEICVMDYDYIKMHNLDRLPGATRNDAIKKTRKVDLVYRNIKNAGTTPGFHCKRIDGSITEPDGYQHALDCDVLFSCVDRPWARQVLNHLSYSSLIPVIDGGISFKTGEAHRFIHGQYAAQTVGPARVCLGCLGSFDPAQVQSDREGLFDNPRYIEELEKSQGQSVRQNIIPFSVGLASLETIQFVELVTNLAKKGDLGQQRYDYYSGELLPTYKSCDPSCEIQKLIAIGTAKLPVLLKDVSKERVKTDQKKGILTSKILERRNRVE